MLLIISNETMKQCNSTGNSVTSNTEITIVQQKRHQRERTETKNDFTELREVI